MAMTINVAGPQEIKVNTGTAGALESLGFTVEGFSFQVERGLMPVFGDQKGGPGGRPIDYQTIDPLVRFNLLLTKFDPAVFEKVQKGLLDDSLTEGTFDTSQRGACIFQDGLAFKFRSVGASVYREFPQCILTVEEAGYGTKHTNAMISVEAHTVLGTGVLYTKGNNA